MEISERTAKLKRNLIVFSLMLLGVVILGVDARNFSFNGITFNGLGTGELAVLGWLICFYHAAAMAMAISSDIGKMVGRVFGGLTDRPGNRSCELMFPFLKGHEQTTWNEHFVNAGKSIAWTPLVAGIWRVAFNGEEKGNYDRSTFRNFWFLDVFFPASVFVIATLVGVWFYIQSHMPHLPQ